MPSLESPDLRLNRAQEHLDILDKKVADYALLKPYELIPECDAEQRISGYIMQVNDVPPPDIGLPIVEFSEGLRSSLDQLVYQVSLLKVPEPEGTEYPIFDKLDGAAIRKRIHGLSPDARKVVRDVQPYQRGDIKAAHEDWLWVLHQLTNLSKHQVNPVIHNGFVVHIEGPLQSASLYIAAPFRSGERLPLSDFPIADFEESPAHFKIDSALAVRVQKADFERLVPLLPHNELRTLYEYVRDKVYRPLAAFLK